MSYQTVVKIPPQQQNFKIQKDNNKFTVGRLYFPLLIKSFVLAS